jgi:hypothetical protein
MTTVSPGALVMVKKMGTILWVVCGRADDGVSWKLRAKRATSAEGRTSAAAWPAPAISSPGTHLLARHHERTHDEDFVGALTYSLRYDHRTGRS